MALKKSWRELSFLASLSLVLIWPAFRPARAELSPDVGLKVEVVSDKKSSASIQAEQQNLKKFQVEKRLAQELKIKTKPVAKKVVASVKKVVAPARIVTATVVNQSTLKENVSVARTNIPEGLTPKVIASTLSTNRGKSASVTIKTLPGARCSIDVFVVTRTPVNAAGLENKIADSEGICTWKWTVKSSTPKGSWGVKISASQGGVSDDTWTTLNVGAVH